MANFGILHLTDLHYGQGFQEDLLPSVRQRLFDDLEILHEFSGPWDLVAFTGDLVNRGDPEEFKHLDGLLVQLWSHLETLGSQPILLAVPGNHDLKRPDGGKPEVMVLRNLATTSDFEQVWKELFANSISVYRRVIDEAFAAFTAWWNVCSLRGQSRQGFHYNPGPLPGDFSAVLEKEGARLGIVGLNTTFLQLTDGNYEGRLGVRARQFNGACGGDGEAWIRELDACILMTHQPPKWLAAKSRADFDELIDRPGRFAAHYCGHLHLQEAESRGRGWSQLRRLVQGGSLFGLEASPEGIERIHAYGASRISLEMTEGIIRHWPRLANRQLGGQLSFARDTSFALEESDGGTHAERFPRLRKIESPLPDSGRKSEPEPNSWLPSISPRPVLDPEALFRRHFIGREDLLLDFKDALDGLDSRSRRAVAHGRSGAVQLIWLHGFGGMGKSWFLRRACIEAEMLSEHQRVALVDWHLPEWHRPAAMPPSDPRDLLEAIAHRLAQLYGVERLEPYWRVHQQVDQNWPKHQQLHDKLDEVMTLIQVHGPDWRTVPALSGHGLTLSGEVAAQLRRLEGILRDRGIWSDDFTVLSRRLNDLRRSLPRFDVPEEGSRGGFFEAWAQDTVGTENESITRPCRLLVETLQSCLRTLCNEAPLMLALDTCELLPTSLEGWLRRLLAPLLDGRTPILVLIGSRRRPDIEVGPGQRGGWRDEVDPVRFRIVPFDEGVRFTITDLAQALTLVHPPVPQDPELPVVLHRVTLGIPLALGALLGMHRAGDPVLTNLSALDRGAVDDLDEARAVQTVIGEVAGRFLVHLADRHEAADDLRDITALALLRRANVEVLNTFWATSWIGERLRMLAQKYALLADGDLHPVVREILRRHWRQSPPHYLSHIAGSLFEALAQIQPEALPQESVWIDWELERLNLLSWLKGENVFPELARSLTVFLAYDLDYDGILKIAQEIRPVRDRGRRAKAMLDSKRLRYWQPWTEHDLILWLEKQCSAEWSVQERACLDLLVGLSLSDRRLHEEAIARLERVFEAFGQNLPRRDTIAQAYFASIEALGQDKTSAAERGYQWALRFNLIERGYWNLKYYWVLHNARRYMEAEAYCRDCIEQEPSHATPYACLGHILWVHLNRPQDAELEFRKGIEVDGAEPNAHFFLGELLEESLRRPEEAEAEYRRTLELLYSPSERCTALCRLGRLLAIQLNRREEAIAIWREALSLGVSDTNTLNSIAWNLYLAQEQLDEAEKLAARGMSTSPGDLNCLHTLAAILVRQNKWVEAEPKVQEWLQKVEVDQLKRGWRDFRPLFNDAITHGHATELRALLSSRQDDPVWDFLRSALGVMEKDPASLSSLPDHL